MRGIGASFTQFDQARALPQPSGIGVLKVYWSWPALFPVPDSDITKAIFEGGYDRRRPDYTAHIYFIPPRTMARPPQCLLFGM